MFGYFFLYLLLGHAGGAGFFEQFLRNLRTYRDRYQQKQDTHNIFGVFSHITFSIV